MKLRTLAAAAVLAAAPVLLTTTQAFAATSHGLAPKGKVPYGAKWTPRHHKCRPCPPHCKPWCHHEHDWGGMSFGGDHEGHGHDAGSEMAFAGML